MGAVATIEQSGDEVAHRRGDGIRNDEAQRNPCGALDDLGQEVWALNFAITMFVLTTSRRAAAE